MDFPIFLVTLLLALAHEIDRGLGEDNEKSHCTSVIGMGELLKTEKKLIEYLTAYTDKLEERLTTLRGAISSMNKEIEKAKIDTEGYLSNPLNAFKLIRRMKEDWLKWELYLRKPIDEAPLTAIESLRGEMPTETDLREAVDAIYRLQTTYDMKPGDMAAGRLNGKQYDTQFSAPDLYSIGYEVFKQADYTEASFWLYTASLIYEESDQFKALDFNQRKIYELYALSLLKLDRGTDALLVMDRAVALSPRDAELLQKKFDMEIHVKTQIYPSHPRLLPRSDTPYKKGCRGEFRRRGDNLHCRYNSTTNAFLKLAPIKMEEISLDPYMILYHGVISDEEIAHLKLSSNSSLKRATVYNDESRTNTVVKTRTSKFSWLNDNATEIVRNLNRRIADMTGFEMFGSEMIQVMNYGLGGHYDTHYDFFNLSMDTNILRMQGDRIATVLFYMSDVEQGGATVFPRLETAVFPQKGSAIMWYNLNNRGEADGRTLHAACPVIVGSKWVCNKWVRERNQFRTRPCPKE